MTLTAQQLAEAWPKNRDGFPKRIETTEDALELVNAALRSQEPRGMTLTEEERWRDISTAPKDGTTQVLLHGPYSADIAIARWTRGKWRCVADGNDAIECQSDFGTEYMTFDAPTHWMPLPAPPKQESSQ